MKKKLYVPQTSESLLELKLLLQLPFSSSRAPDEVHDDSGGIYRQTPKNQGFIRNSYGTVMTQRLSPAAVSTAYDQNVNQNYTVPNRSCPLRSKVLQEVHDGSPEAIPSDYLRRVLHNREAEINSIGKEIYRGRRENPPERYARDKNNENTCLQRRRNNNLPRDISSTAATNLVCKLTNGQPELCTLMLIGADPQNVYLILPATW